jgi:hypothetical protein
MRRRERKKAKAHELEKTVAALSEQLQSMAGVKQENSELQDRNLALINRLRSKEEELERMLREQARPGTGLTVQHMCPLGAFQPRCSVPGTPCLLSRA